MHQGHFGHFGHLKIRQFRKTWNFTSFSGRPNSERRNRSRFLFRRKTAAIVSEIENFCLLLPPWLGRQLRKYFISATIWLNREEPLKKVIPWVPNLITALLSVKLSLFHPIICSRLLNQDLAVFRFCSFSVSAVTLNT